MKPVKGALQKKRGGFVPSEQKEARVPIKFANRRPGWELPQVHQGLQLDSFDELEGKGRDECPKCQRRKHLYCYDCLVPFTSVPNVPLPFNVSIITHHGEARSKNTGVQAVILAPAQVQLHSIEVLPALDKARSVVLFPGPDAIDVEDLQPDSIDQVIILDSKWFKAKELAGHDKLQGVRQVKLKETRTAFWRFHTAGVADEGVCTIEALLFFLDALVKHGKVSGPRFSQGHAFDNLLYYFVFQHKLITERRGLTGDPATTTTDDDARAGKKPRTDSSAAPPQDAAAAPSTSLPQSVDDASESPAVAVAAAAAADGASLMADAGPTHHTAMAATDSPPAAAAAAAPAAADGELLRAGAATTLHPAAAAAAADDARLQ